MDKLKLIHQLFIGKVADEIGNNRAQELLEESKNAINSFPKPSCVKPCSPSDWYEGGKCDLNGCYHK